MLLALGLGGTYGDIVWPWGAFGAHLEDGLVNSSFRKAAQQVSPAVGDFSCRMRFHSVLLNRMRLAAAYSFMKALALPWLVVKV